MIDLAEGALERLLDEDPGGPVVMLNLLRSRPGGGAVRYREYAARASRSPRGTARSSSSSARARRRSRARRARRGTPLRSCAIPAGGHSRTCAGPAVPRSPRWAARNEPALSAPSRADMAARPRRWHDAPVPQRRRSGFCARHTCTGAG